LVQLHGRDRIYYQRIIGKSAQSAPASCFADSLVRQPDQFDFGYPIYRASPNSFEHPRGDWRYCDDDSPVKLLARRCPACFELRTMAGHDPCIADLPGVYSACCGHGVVEPYVNIYGEMTRLIGAAALDWFRRHGKGPPQ
jgi:hypothetical protein